MSAELESEEQRLLADPRLGEAIALFNAGQWYACHDGFEALWHETAGPMRPLLQGILQVAVAHLHLERGNRRGATILLGEALGRLRRCGDPSLGLALGPLRRCVEQRLQALQAGAAPQACPEPRLCFAPVPPAAAPSSSVPTAGAPPSAVPTAGGPTAGTPTASDLAPRNGSVDCGY